MPARVTDDIKIALKDGFDFVELDGMQGSTGAGPADVMEHVGIPTIAAIQEALDALESIGHARGIQIVLMGGIKDGIDAVKALALGADAVGMGTSVIIAGGCIACMQCHVGTCVVGIATQDPEHEKRYDIDHEARNIHRFLESVRWQIASLTPRAGLRRRAPIVARRPRGPDSRSRGDHALALHARAPRARPPRKRRGAHRMSAAPREAFPPELADDDRRCPLCAGAVPDRLPGRHRRALLSRLYLGGEVRGGVRGHHRHQPFQLDLRAGV